MSDSMNPISTDVQDLEVASKIDEFCHAMRTERNASAHTVRNYCIDLEDYARWAERAHVDALHPNHRQLRRYLAELDSAQYARTTINRHMSSVRGFLRWMVIAGYSTDNPAEVLMSLKRDKSLPHRISADDMAAILSVHAPLDANGRVRDRTPEDMRDQAVLEFLYACGARVSEASDLRTASVDLDHAQVRVIGKGNKERIIPLHDLAVASMRAYRDAARSQLVGKNGDNDYFFLSSRGNRYSPDAIRKMFKQTLAEAGVQGDFTPHDMRHTFASDVLEGGADLRSVQEMLGHSSLSTTQIYTHLSVGRIRKVHQSSHPRG